MSEAALATSPPPTAIEPGSVPSGRWDGGTSPYAVSWQKMMMWWFIVSDALLFAGFLASYGWHRLASDVPWPDQSKVFHLEFITLMTFILISSSATMACAVLSFRRQRKQGTDFKSVLVP